MSLITEQMETCTMIDKHTDRDGYGGIITTWVDGAEFQAAIAFESTTQARIGAVQGLTSLYNVITGKNVTLQFHDVFRRERDRKIFRVTQDGTDQKTPVSAGLQYRRVYAEEWSLPNG